MNRWRTLFDRNTLIAWLLALSTGVVLWQTDLEDRRSLEEKKADTFRSRLTRVFWSPDGQPGWAAPLPGNLGGNWRFKSYDWMFLLRHTLFHQELPPEVLILSMDEESHHRLDQPLAAPWDRAIHARTLERLLTNGARAVIFDVVFGDLRRFTDAAANNALIRAVVASSNRVVVAYAIRKPEGTDIERTWIPGTEPPFAELRRALILPARPDVVENRYYAGLPEMESDYDQRVRRHPPSYYPNKHSLAWSMAGLLQLPCITQTNSPPGHPEEEERWLNYYGPAGFLDTIPYYEVLTNKPGSDPVPGLIFSNRVIFIGAGTLNKFSGERKDAYINPYAARGGREERFIAGVEIHATAALNLMRGESLRRLNLRTELLLILLTALIAGFAFTHLGAWSMTSAALAGILSIVSVAFWLFYRHHLWFGWLIPVTQILVTWLFALIANSARLFIQNRLYQRQLALYLSPKLVRKFAQDKDHAFTKPGANKQALTIFFSDIAGFTSISEGLDSDDLAHLMNQYFEDSVGNCIFPEDGTVVKYIGDAIFAFWNAPDPQADHATRACHAALRFRKQKILSVKGRSLITRIGLHSGVANVGNFGSKQRVDYTAIGENINLASRMEGLNKYLGTQTLVTEACYSAATDQFTFRPLGKFILKGFERAFGVYELCGAREQGADFAELHQAFAKGVAFFQQGNLEAARVAFQDVHQKWPDDGPTRFYLQTLNEFAGKAPAEEWTGAIELKEK